MATGSVQWAKNVGTGIPNPPGSHRSGHMPLFNGKPCMTQEEYDGKRLRKTSMRKTVDYNCSVIKYLSDRVFQRGVVDRPSLQPDVLYYPEMHPPLGYMDNPINAVCTRFVRTATNKMRCPVFCLAWTPEGRRLITGASSGEFTLWNGLTFNFETILQAHDTSVRCMVWSHSDQWMVTGDHSGYVKYWQMNMNNVKMFQAHKDPIRGISFSPSDNKLATCSDDGTVRIWDFNRCHEEKVLRGHGSDVKCCDWHPYKGLVVSGSKDNQQPVRLWDPKSGTSLATLHAHKSTVTALKFNSNGNWLLTASRDHLLKLFDLRNLSQELQVFRGHKKEAFCVSWHPVHETLVASGGSDGSIMFWNVGAEKEVGCIEQAHDSLIWELSWHPLGHVLASGSNDHTSRFWTRNRPGDTMMDKYNLNIGESADQTTGKLNTSATLDTSDTGLDGSVSVDGETLIPGMGPGDRVDPSAAGAAAAGDNPPGHQDEEPNTRGRPPMRRPNWRFAHQWNQNWDTEWDENGEDRQRGGNSGGWRGGRGAWRGRDQPERRRHDDQPSQGRYDDRRDPGRDQQRSDDAWRPPPESRQRRDDMETDDQQQSRDRLGRAGDWRAGADGEEPRGRHPGDGGEGRVPSPRGGGWGRGRPPPGPHSEERRFPQDMPPAMHDQSRFREPPRDRHDQFRGGPGRGLPQSGRFMDGGDGGPGRGLPPSGRFMDGGDGGPGRGLPPSGRFMDGGDGGPGRGLPPSGRFMDGGDGGPGRGLPPFGRFMDGGDGGLGRGLPPSGRFMDGGDGGPGRGLPPSGRFMDGGDGGPGRGLPPSGRFMDGGDGGLGRGLPPSGRFMDGGDGGPGRGLPPSGRFMDGGDGGPGRGLPPSGRFMDGGDGGPGRGLPPSGRFMDGGDGGPGRGLPPSGRFMDGGPDRGPPPSGRFMDGGPGRVDDNVAPADHYMDADDGYTADNPPSDVYSEKHGGRSEFADKFDRGPGFLEDHSGVGGGHGLGEKLDGVRGFPEEQVGGRGFGRGRGSTEWRGSGPRRADDDRNGRGAWRGGGGRPLGRGPRRGRGGFY